MGNLCPTVTCLGTLYSADCTVKGYYVPVPVRRVIQLSGVAVYVEFQEPEIRDSCEIHAKFRSSMIIDMLTKIYIGIPMNLCALIVDLLSCLMKSQ